MNLTAEIAENAEITWGKNLITAEIAGNAEKGFNKKITATVAKIILAGLGGKFSE